MWIKKWAVWRLFWANFAVVGAMKFPFCVVSAREGLEMLDMGYARVCWCCSESFCFAGPRFSAFGTFLPQAGGFYVGLRGCFQERLLCVFTRATLSILAKLSPERRLLCARANRECATKRGARTQTSDLADVLAVSRDANAVLCWPGDANRCFSAPRDQKRTTWSADEQAMDLADSRLRGPNQTRFRRAWNAGWFHHA